MKTPLFARYQLQVATLAESPAATTCSALVARRHHLRIVPSGSFEEAISFVKAGMADAALVPSAYPGINRFFMDPALRLFRAFAAKIPALILAARPEAKAPFREVHAHPATRPFWAELDAPIIEAASNDAAAAAVVGKDIACITNEIAAKSAGLQILWTFREASLMGWNLFVRAGAVRPQSSTPATGPTAVRPKPVEFFALPELAAHPEISS